MGWTFDPLRRENAHFNLEILGVEARLYHPELYGPMPDALNAGLLSDRLEVHWHLKSGRVKALAKAKPKPLIFKPEALPPTLLSNQAGAPKFHPGPLDSPSYLLDIPADLEGLRAKSPGLAHEWYYALRELLGAAFGGGYKISRVYLPPDRPEVFCYLLEQDPVWLLYLLETGDGTFYAGITNDLGARLAAHNAGRGAAYTAKRLPVKLLAAWRVGEQGAALKAERAIKKLSRAQKAALVRGGGAFGDCPRI
jgi:predicted GIY-YIG superfamily endonuclease